MLVSAPRRNAIISLIADHFSVMTERHTKGVFFVCLSFACAQTLAAEMK